MYKKADWKTVFIKEAGSEGTSGFVIDGISYDPYYTLEEVNKDSGFLPKTLETVRLGQLFDFRNGKNPLDELKNSLSHDFDAPVFLIDETTDISSFEEIRMEYIFPRFQLQDVGAMALIGQLKENYKSKIWEPVFVCKYDLTQEHTISAQKIFFEYKTAENVAAFINQLFIKLDELTNFDPENVIINTTLSGQFISDIVKVRAIKIAWFNYLENRDLPVRPFFNEITWDLDNTYPEVLLGHSNNIVSAIIAQADNIILDLKGTSDENRILRNSCHIALIESHMSKEQDPGAGSYFLENVAGDLAERAFIVES